MPIDKIPDAWRKRLIPLWFLVAAILIWLIFPVVRDALKNGK
jgi:hypothetical protein